VNEECLLRQGDVLFNWRNGSQHHFGKTAYFDPEGQFTNVGFILKIRVDESICNGRFLWYKLNALKSRGFFLTAKIQVNNTFNSNELNAVTLALPERKEQDVITAHLDATEASIASEKSSLRKLEKLKVGLMQDLLTGKVRVTALLKKNKEQLAEIT
jgi:type I restriction enzyme S subunit